MSNEMYAFAIKRKDEKTYVMPSNDFGLPVHETPEKAKSDAGYFTNDPSEYIIIDVSALVERGIISRHRLFGSGARS